MLKLIAKMARIKQKLIGINLMTTGIALLLAGSSLLLYELFSFRDSMLNNLMTQARIFAEVSTAPLTFGDQKTAGEDLRALKASPNILCAILYGKDGKVFAEYWRDGAKRDSLPVPQQKDGHLFTINHLDLFHSIVLDRETIGKIYLRSDMDELYSMVLKYGVISVMVMLIVFSVAYLLLTRFQKVITVPILDLAETVQVVSSNKDYTRKANVYSEDEIGFLAKGFNEMLEQIRQRDTKLLTEIAERKEAEDRLRQAKEEWERTFDAIVDPVMIADANHRIIKANKAMADKLGISPAEAEGLACYNAVHGASEPPLFCPHSKLLADGLPHSVEIYEERLGGHFIVSVSPLFTSQGELYGSVHYARDITKRKLAEESVCRLNEELEQKVAERTSQLLEAQEELVRKEKLSILGQLSGSVGHELRNPLGVMNNSVYFLKTLMANANETVMEYLDIIKHEIDNSERIITDLLDFARTKTPQKMAVMVGDLMEESLQRCALPENVDIQSDIPDKLPPLNVDPLQMGQVFQNLISNAIQAMPEGGHLRIRARQVNNVGAALRGGLVSGDHIGSPLPETGNFIEICVADTGTGISPENMKKLFHPLFTTKPKGIGLGLTVCRNLTEANGGAIEVVSKLGEGTTFTVTLPAVGKEEEKNSITLL